MTSQFFTPVEAARLLRVKPVTVLAWIKSGQISAILTSADPGTQKPRYVISKDAIDDFTASRSTTAPPKKSTRRKPKSEPRRYV